jgi:hypothetical protein
MQWLVDEGYPEATVIRVILDNLNTHKPASLHETFAPGEARRLLKKLEFHYMPKHGSWLNMAEIELSILSRQCLGRHIPDDATTHASGDKTNDGQPLTAAPPVSSRRGHAR